MENKTEEFEEITPDDKEYLVMLEKLTEEEQVAFVNSIIGVDFS